MTTNKIMIRWNFITWLTGQRPISLNIFQAWLKISVNTGPFKTCLAMKSTNKYVAVIPEEGKWDNQQTLVKFEFWLKKNLQWYGLHSVHWMSAVCSISVLSNIDIQLLSGCCTFIPGRIVTVERYHCCKIRTLHTLFLGLVLMQETDTITILSANESPVFNESCSPIG